MNHKEIFRIIDSLDQSSKDRFVREIKTYNNECGCRLGGIFAVSATIICILYSLISFKPVSVLGGLRMLLWSAMAIVAAGLVGKGIGIGVARIKLRVLYRKVLSIRH